MYNRAQKSFETSVQMKAWKIWSLYIKEKKKEKSKIDIAIKHYKKTILRKVLYSWKLFHKEVCLNKKLSYPLVTMKLHSNFVTDRTQKYSW